MSDTDHGCCIDDLNELRKQLASERELADLLAESIRIESVEHSPREAKRCGSPSCKALYKWKQARLQK